MKSDNNVNVKKVFSGLGILLLNFILLYGGYSIIVELGERLQLPILYYIGTTVYMVALAGLLIAFYILNGFSFDKQTIHLEDLPVEWNMAEKKAYLEKRTANREKAKKLIYVLLPLVVTVAISYIELWFFS